MYAELIADLEDPNELIANQARAFIYCLTDLIASQAKAELRLEMPQSLVDIYNAYRAEGLQEKKKMYMFGYNVYRKLKESDHQAAWKLYLEIRQGLGGSKTNILAGHSLIDTLPGLATRYEEAMDIINCAYAGGFNCIKLLQADIVLSGLLMDSNFSVVCPSNGRGYATSKPGIYARAGTMKCMNWSTIRQKTPEIKGTRVEFPLPEELHDADTFGYEFVPARFEEKYYYLPSMKAADGYCIKTNSKINFTVRDPKDFITRFSSAVYTRCQFMFTRVTFPQVDEMRMFFTYGVVLKKVRPENSKVPEGIEALMLKTREEQFSSTAISDWTLERSAPPPYLRVSAFSTIIHDVPVVGHRVTRKDNTEGLRKYLSAKTFTLDERRELIFSYWYHNRVSVSELNDLLAPCIKADALGILVDAFQLKAEVTFDHGGQCTFDRLAFQKFLRTLPPTGPPITIIGDSPPSTVAGDSEEVDPIDPYGSAPAAIVIPVDDSSL